MAPSRSMPPWKRLLLARVFPWLVVLVGLLSIYVGVENALRARASAEWPSVEGTVVRTSIDRESSPGGGRDRSGSSVTWRPVVVYEYVVDATRYEGQRISFGEYATGERADAEALVRKYQKGARVPVSYSPEDPGLAVIEPGSAGVPWFFVVLGGAFLAAGLLFVALFPRLLARDAS